MSPFDSIGPGNWVRQCTFCRTAHLQHFIFDDRARAIAVADARPVLTAPLTVLRDIWELLNREFRGRP